MTPTLQRSVATLLVVTQLGLSGCSAGPVVADAPRAVDAPVVTLQQDTPSQGLEGLVRRAGSVAAGPSSTAGESGLTPTCGFPHFSDGEMVLLVTLAGVAIVTAPVWGPVYWLFSLVDR